MGNSWQRDDVSENEDKSDDELDDGKEAEPSGCAQDEMQDKLAALLKSHNITSGSNELLHELRAGYSTLSEEGHCLVRKVALVEVSIVAAFSGGNVVLVEEEAVLHDGSKRSGRSRRPHGRVRVGHGEAMIDAAQRVLVERLGNGAPAAVELRPELRKCSEDTRDDADDGDAFPEAEIERFPGLQTQCARCCFELRLPICEANGGKMRWADNRHEEVPESWRALLAHLSLPFAHPFLTVNSSGPNSRPPTVHLWRWQLVEADRSWSNNTSERERVSSIAEDPEDVGINAMSASACDEVNEDEAAVTKLEQSYRDLSSVLHLVMSQKAHLAEHGGPLDMRLSDAEARLRRVMKNVSKFERMARVRPSEIFSNADENPDFSQDAGGRSNAKRMTRTLRNFITRNFTQSHLDEDEAEVEALDSQVSQQPSYELSRKRRSDDELTSMLEEVRAGQDSYVLDMLSLHKRTGRRSMVLVAELLVIPNASELGILERTMRSFAEELHRCYEEHQNPFHNEAHAALVCHAAHWFAVRGKAWSGTSPWIRIATDLSALAHDVGHFGRNNAFCNNVTHELAITYNDRSILENMHAATCFKLMKAKGCDILADTTRENRRSVREHMVDLILATDMASHFEFLSKFRVRSSSPEFNPKDNADDRRIVSHCYLKAADLGHAALTMELHEQWAIRLLQEFYNQGDEERTLGVPISPMCERSGSTEEFCQSQKGFLQFVILPLFKELSIVTAPEIGEVCITRIEVNAEEWARHDPSEELVAVVKATAPA